LEGGLHPSLESFGPFLLTKIKFFKFYDCKTTLP
jgi:hypothetical protein